MAIKPKLAMIPSGVGTDTLYSVLPSDGTGDFNFVRNSGGATRINKDGLIEMVGPDVPRLNYPLIDGVVSGCPSLLLENIATNIIPRSEDIDTGWSKSNVTVANNQTISPNGTLNAGLVTATSTTGQHILFHTLIGSVTAGTDYFTSCFLKKSTTRYIRLIDNFSGAIIYIDLDTNLIISEGGGASESIIENYGNGWFRVGFKFTADSSGNTQLALYVNDNSNNNDYAGSGESVYIWGAQVEQGSYPTSYIPSLSNSQTTRSAEAANNSGDANTFNDSEGVLFAEIAKNKGNQYSLISLFKSSVSDTYIYIGYLDNTTTIRGQIKIGGTTVLDEEIEMADTNINAKVSVRYKSGDYSLYVNGLEVGSSSSTAIFTDGDLNEIQFGFANNSIFDFYGNTKQIQYFDTALNDTDLETLTSWTSFNEMATSQLYSIQ